MFNASQLPLINILSVKQRLNSTGLSFSEFAYQLLQAYDFFWLHQNKNVHLQIGGSDQWGNIILGVELIHRVLAAETNNVSSMRDSNPETGELPKIYKVAGLTTPLLTEKDTGKKFGKSEGNAIWLDDKMTSVFDFYQVRLRTGGAYQRD